MNRRSERELRVIAQMVGLYCRSVHGTRQGLCAECAALLDYAAKRIEHCPLGDRKTSCRKCTIHCYRPDMRDHVRSVMRYAGPRMILHHPLAAIRHLLDEAGL